MSNPFAITGILFVIGLHIGFFVLESVLWTTPKVMKWFDNTLEEASVTRVLALNQGFYNLGLAGLLLWFFFTNNTTALSAILLFIAGMGIIGALTADWRILVVQTLPALGAWGLLYP